MKLARVNLEAEVWGDPRFPHLERLLGYPPCSGHLAIARMAMIWGWQVEHYTPEAPCFHAPEEVIEMALAVDGPTAIAALVRARLAEVTPEGVRMKGSSHEATGWLWRIRQKSAAGVEARKQKASAKRNDRDVSQPVVDLGSTVGQPELNPLGSGLSVPESDVSLSASAREGQAGEPAPPAVASATPAAQPTNRGHDLFAQIVEELHDRHAAEARKLKAAIPGCANVSIGGGLLTGETRTAVLDAVSRWSAEARELGADTREHIAARMNHLVAVRAATARREKHLRWWTSGRFWRWAGIEIDLGQTVEQARAVEKPREGARFAHERPAPTCAAAPSVADTARKLEEQRAADRVAAADRDAVNAELARAKEALGLVGGLAKKMGGQR